mgnify:CR=1 FL=1
MVETTAPVKTIKKAAPKAAPKAQKALYAVFATGGKQYRVQVGDLVKIEKLSDTHKESESDFKQNCSIQDSGRYQIQTEV